MDKFIKVTHKWYFPFILFIIYSFIVHLYTGNVYGDDKYFVKMMIDNGYFNLIISKFKEYGNNPALFSLQLLFSYVTDWVWRILDIFVMVIIPYMIMKLSFNDKKIEYAYLVCAIWVFYPFIYSGSAGWIITTMGYLWNLPLILYYLLIVKDIFSNKSIKTYRLVIGCLLIAYVTSFIIGKLIFIIMLPLFLVYAYKINARKSFFVISFIITIINIMFQSLQSGAKNRFSADMIAYFQDFLMLTIPEKIQIGFMQVTANMFLNANFVSLILCLVVVLSVYKLYSQKIIRIIALFPLMIQIIFGYCYGILTYLYPSIKDIIPNTVNYLSMASVYKGIVNANNYFDILSYFPLILMILAFSTLAIAILYSMKNKVLAILSSIGYIIGIGTATMVGFAPSIYVSAYRTQTYAFFAIILIIVMIVGQNKYLLYEDRYRFYRYFILISSLLISFIQFVAVYKFTNAVSM